MGLLVSDTACRTPSQHPKTALPGNLKAVGLKMFGHVFIVIKAEIDPGTPLYRLGLPEASIYAKNQLRAPILNHFVELKKSRQTAFKYPVSHVDRGRGRQGDKATARLVVLVEAVDVGDGAKANGF